jgi:hypothetical protein
VQGKLRGEFLTNGVPYFSIQPPSVQQHKMTISCANGLPPKTLHRLLFSFFHKEDRYANSAWLVLAMPDAADAEPMGDLFGL